MSEQAANTPPAEPILCKMGCGFFVSLMNAIKLFRFVQICLKDDDDDPCFLLPINCAFVFVTRFFFNSLTSFYYNKREWKAINYQ